MTKYAHHKTNLKMTLIAGSGSILETYEFMIFAMLTSYISQAFFGDDPNHIKALAAFAIGYLARPIGGVIFGIIGDIYGRRLSFSYSLIMIACATLGIAITPGHESIGWLAPCALLFFRGCQGISYGAELAGAITLVREYAPENRRGFYLSFVMICVFFGSFLASGMVYIVSYLPIPMATYGWRIPFLIGGIAGLFSLYVRSTLQESPEFLERKKKEERENIRPKFSQPLKILLKDYKPQLLSAFGANIFFTLMTIVYFYLPTYLKTYTTYHSSTIFGMMSLVFLISIFVSIIGGFLADKGQKLPIMMGIITFFFLLLIPIHTWLLESSNLWALFTGIALFQCTYLIYWPSFSVFVTDTFPVEIRYTAIAFTYNFTYFFLSLLPMALAFAFQTGFNPWLLPSVIIAISLLSLTIIIYTWRKSLTREPLLVSQTS
jgi:MHS family proline/betaine transporter-like MFS transporter